MLDQLLSGSINGVVDKVTNNSSEKSHPKPIKSRDISQQKPTPSLHLTLLQMLSTARNVETLERTNISRDWAALSADNQQHHVMELG